MRERFIVKRFAAKSEGIISQAADIMSEYAADGYDLSLRQLFYQFVSRDLLPNTQRQYKALGGIISDARLAGLLDWNMLVDRGRSSESNSHWGSPRDILNACASSFAIDKWKTQPNHVEVMVEKQALEGVLEPVCSKLDVTFTANKGYSSQSMMYRKGKELMRKATTGKTLHVLYLGDHDPSGLDMDRDVRERLTMFSAYSVNVERLALTYDQVLDFKPPPNPTKMTDSRAEAYVREYGHESWELDAVEPRTLARLVTEAVEALRDDDLWEEAEEREAKMTADLVKMADEYEDDEDDYSDDEDDDE